MRGQGRGRAKDGGPASCTRRSSSGGGTEVVPPGLGECVGRRGERPDPDCHVEVARNWFVGVISLPLVIRGQFLASRGPRDGSTAAGANPKGVQALYPTQTPELCVTFVQKGILSAIWGVQDANGAWTMPEGTIVPKDPTSMARIVPIGTAAGERFQCLLPARTKPLNPQWLDTPQVPVVEDVETEAANAALRCPLRSPPLQSTQAPHNFLLHPQVPLGPLQNLGTLRLSWPISDDGDARTKG